MINSIEELTDLEGELDRVQAVLRDIQLDVMSTRQRKEIAIEDEEQSEGDSCDRSMLRAMEIYASFRNEELDLQRRIVRLGGTLA